MSEVEQTRSNGDPRAVEVWPLVTALALGMLPWLVTTTVLGIACSDTVIDDGVCDATSKGTVFLLLAALQLPVLIGWLATRKAANGAGSPALQHSPCSRTRW
jgi:hypothetical protein